MSNHFLIERLANELDCLLLIDPHTHINPHAPASKSLADILGYHYYTELAHSAGMPRERIEEPGLAPKEKVARLIEWLPQIANTVQYSWLLEICRKFFDFQADDLHASNWEALYDSSLAKMAAPGWDEQVLKRS